MISFNIKGAEKNALKFLNSIHFIKLVVCHDGAKSLTKHPSTTTLADVDSKTKKEFSIIEKMSRLSIGVENCDDIIDDLKQALTKLLRKPCLIPPSRINITKKINPKILVLQH